MKNGYNMSGAKTIIHKGYKFILKEKDGDFYLIIPSTIGVGSDIIHEFTKKDKKDYNDQGEVFIDKQIEKMRKNPQDFFIKSWR